MSGIRERASNFSVKNFLSLRQKKVRSEKNFVGEAISVSIISDIEKIFCLRGLYQEFSSKVFLTRSTKKFRRGGWREYQDFPSIFFVSVPKQNVGDCFSVSPFSGIEKFST